MRVLQVHNFYKEPGGEDQVYAAEYELLIAYGHAVRQYSVANDAIHGIAATAAAGARAIWNPQSYRAIRRAIREFSPDVVHVHNTVPLISPAVYDAAHASGVPVVQTLHNYRLLCPNATFFRAGQICEQCLGSAVPYRAVVNRCYRNSTGASALMASVLVAHRLAGTWSTKVDRYIAATNFSRNKFIEGGLPAGKISVKPHFLSRDPGAGKGKGGYALFVGRLSPEKGLHTLLEAWAELGTKIPLKIAGDGPLGGYVKERSAALRDVQWVGFCARDAVLELMRDAAVLICPSQTYEGMPMAMLEAFACGTPVIASALGSLNELVTDEVNGYRFPPGNSAALAACVDKAFAGPQTLPAMRVETRRTYERRYTPQTNYEQLLRIYDEALKGGTISTPIRGQATQSPNSERLIGNLAHQSTPNRVPCEIAFAPKRAAIVHPQSTTNSSFASIAKH